MAIFKTIAVFAAMLVSPAFAGQHGGPTCDKRPSVIEQLESKHAEKPVARGLSNSGGMVEVLSTKEGGTWTIVITLPNGMTCLVAAGEDWESFPKVAFGVKS